LGPAPVLTTRQRCHLRGLGHHLEPVVLVGKEGVTEALCTAVSEALFRHELIKLRLAETVEGDRHELAAELSGQCRAALVQVLGRTLLLYRRRPAGGRAGVPDRRPHVPLQ
jgi:RNA-binding protein